VATDINREADIPGSAGSFDPRILRLLDANCNRARESMRVLEDYARFVLDDADLQARLKSLRHDFAQAIAPFSADAILHRDTPGDIGTAFKTPSEVHRPNLAAVIIAAGKRLGEALRAIEEALKATSGPGAAVLESLRYRFYDIEQAIARTLHPETGPRLAAVRLYTIVTASLCRKPWLSAAEEAILGGADCMQLREKDLDSGELLVRARQLVELCRRHGVPCIINDRPDIALLAQADGVHVGQQDLPAVEVRRLLGSQRIVGVSTHNLDQGRQAIRDGADYIGVGPFFRSSTKPRDFVAGPEYARAAAGLGIPAIAIAGINAENVDEVLATGVKAIAVSSAIFSREDVRGAAVELKRKIVDCSSIPV
jgi:thiamine-phosphate pyrophosphorylase